MKETLKARRQARGWSLRELAERTGLRHQQLSRYEDEERGPGPEHLELLARVFECSPHDLLVGPQRKPGRQAQSGGELVARFRVSPVTSGVRRAVLARRLPAARKNWPHLMGELERLVPQDRRLALERLPGDSSLEALFLLQELHWGAVPVEATPLEVGFDRFPVVSDDGRRTTGHCKVPALVTRDWLMLLQVTVATPRLYRLDGLVVVKQPTRVFLNLEIDGEGHTRVWEEERTRALGLPSLRLTESQVVEQIPLVERLKASGYCHPRKAR